MSVTAKICGINAPEAMAAAVSGGASHVGLVFFPPSPRAVSPLEAGRLAAAVPAGIDTVGLFVDPDDGLIDAVLEAVPLDMLQLHGAEGPDRVAAIRRRTGRKVMKAIPVAVEADLDAVERYGPVADWLLFDAKPPKDKKDALPGGNALSFNWTLLQGRRCPLPWMLAGGLTADNVADAAQMTGARTVDTSSGVEDAPGIKNPEKIKAFLRTVATL